MKTINKKTILAGLLAVAALVPAEAGAFGSTLATSMKAIFATCTNCLETCLWRPYCPKASTLTCKYFKGVNDYVAEQANELRAKIKNIGSASPSLKGAVDDIGVFLALNLGASVHTRNCCLVCKLGGCPAKKSENDIKNSFNSVVRHADFSAIEQSLYRARDAQAALATVKGLSPAAADDLSKLAKNYTNVSLTPSLKKACVEAEKQLGEVSKKLTNINKTLKPIKE